MTDKQSIHHDQSDASDNSCDNNKSNDRAQKQADDHQKEIGGPKGPEPTRYGDWERKGRCVDF